MPCPSNLQTSSLQKLGAEKRDRRKGDRDKRRRLSDNDMVALLYVERGQFRSFIKTPIAIAMQHAMNLHPYSS